MSDLLELNEIEENTGEVSEIEEEFNETEIEDLSTDSLIDIDNQKKSYYDIATDEVLSELSLDELREIRDSFDDDNEQKVLTLKRR